MHKLAPLSPLGSDTPRVDTIGNLTVSEVTDRALASVAARKDQEPALRAALAEAYEMELPEVGGSSQAGTLSVFWTGPDQWMVSGPYDQHELLARDLKQVAGATASVVEQTDGWCRFDVAGAALCDLFERLSNAPVRDMKPGCVIRGTLEHLGVFLWRLDEDRMAVLGPRSSAASLHHALITAARSIA
ncbi:Sarcosine oxidase gamma subunit (plasmid) [Phaeobacter piscinae]|uniref:Sarcosine oxidase gamma subunit n=1 Tax=Phaeobacter piscinae TaxID=1580596 RepID=A0ABM6PIS1_9RHOB|nr:sarcosine oxidase subunit gamma family protein [Phaeobacter piscinae]ATG37688.1 Sarcosine oxidase gamma subunit [Phaeobacter piscinae]AUQ88209.1 Sarcosine oxidase gamma subunit [Phaeobacter piscinae]AUR26092.1 Sarcosine oxidase gamma subunit [Phaeobacter piscinae]